MTRTVFWPAIEPIIATNIAQSLEALGEMRGKEIALDEIECNTAQMWEMGKAISGSEYVSLLAQMNVITRQVQVSFRRWMSF